MYSINQDGTYNVITDSQAVDDIKEILESGERDKDTIGLIKDVLTCAGRTIKKVEL